MEAKGQDLVFAYGIWVCMCTYMCLKESMCIVECVCIYMCAHACIREKACAWLVCVCYGSEALRISEGR